MKRKKTWARTLVVLLAMTCLVVLGCDDTSPDNALTVDPAQADLGRGDARVLFTVMATTNKASFMPLDWSVTDPSLGNIIESRGFSAVYGRTGRQGHNTVIVKDQAGNEGLASVLQH